MAAQALPIPRYGVRSLAELMPSMLSALGVGGFANPLALSPVSRAVLFLVDGLGDEQLRSHARIAPFLNARRGEPLSAGFPATTVASLGSVGTGLTPGEHGLVGYTFGLTGYDRAINVLSWSLYGLGPQVDLRQAIVPERFQPLPTVFERAALFHAGWIGAWTFWVLTGAVLGTFVIGAIAVAHAARSDTRSTEQTAPQ